jgi:hypothetical protein
LGFLARPQQGLASLLSFGVDAGDELFLSLHNSIGGLSQGDL